MSDRFEAGTGDAGGEASTARTRRRLIIAIDGPAGSGKSSTAKALAKRLKLPYIDTGAMYRAVTLKVMRQGVGFSDIKKLAQIVRKSVIRLDNGRVFLDGKNVTRAIRHPELTKNVFYVAREPLVRREMVKKQRAVGKARGGVMEGRDIGTVVFPDAGYKFYFDANPKIRAKRRYRELVGAQFIAPKGAINRAPTLRQVLKDLRKRDRSDRRRKKGPLKRAEDAIVIDTTSLTINETVDRILALVGSNLLKTRRLGARRPRGI